MFAPQQALTSQKSWARTLKNVATLYPIGQKAAVEKTHVYIWSPSEVKLGIITISCFSRARATHKAWRCVMERSWGIGIDYFAALPRLSATDPIHDELKAYGGQHEKLELLTASQFDAHWSHKG